MRAGAAAWMNEKQNHYSLTVVGLHVALLLMEEKKHRPGCAHVKDPKQSRPRSITRSQFSLRKRGFNCTCSFHCRQEMIPKEVMSVAKSGKMATGVEERNEEKEKEERRETR